jgi:PKD repeat protein
MRVVLLLVAAMVVAGCATPASNNDGDKAQTADDKPLPRVSFDYSPKTPRVGEPVRFFDFSRSVKDDPIVQRTWTFGDGSRSTESAPNHVFNNAGAFKVTLRVQTESGAANASTHTLDVLDAGARDPKPSGSNDARPPPMEPIDPNQIAPPPDANAAVVALREGLRAAQATGGTFSLDAILADAQFGGGGSSSSFAVRVATESFMDVPHAWAEIDGERIMMPFVEVYEGHVDGAEEQIVRLTLTWDWARGTIRVNDAIYLVRIGLDGNLPRTPDRPGQGHDGFQQPPDGMLFDGPEWDDRDEGCEGNLEQWAPIHADPQTNLGHSAADVLTADAILDADRKMWDWLGWDAFPIMIAMLNEADSIFAHEVGIRFRLSGVHVNTDARFYPEPADAAPLDQMAKYWDKRTDAHRDLVHLFTGYDSNYAQANCISGAGQPLHAYTFTPLPWEQRYETLHTNVIAHELGHIFSAHHHYGNHAETRDLATIMIQGYTPGYAPVFSTLSKSVIRGWAEDHI